MAILHEVKFNSMILKIVSENIHKCFMHLLKQGIKFVNLC